MDMQEWDLGWDTGIAIPLGWDTGIEFLSQPPPSRLAFTPSTAPNPTTMV